MEKLELFDVNSKLLDDWYTTCFAGVICDTVLVKIWDKVCGGAKKIVVFLFIELMKDIRSFICDLRSQEELKVLVEMVRCRLLIIYMFMNFFIFQKKDQDGVIVNKAIKSWHSNNSEVEYVH